MCIVLLAVTPRDAWVSVLVAWWHCIPLRVLRGGQLSRGLGPPRVWGTVGLNGLRGRNRGSRTKDPLREGEVRTQRSAGPSGRGRLLWGGPKILVTGEAPPTLCTHHEWGVGDKANLMQKREGATATGFRHTVELSEGVR